MACASAPLRAAWPQRFRRLDTASRYQISVKHIDPELPAIAEPELVLHSVGGVPVLEGDLFADVVPAVLRGLQLLGPEIVDPSAQDAHDR